MITTKAQLDTAMMAPNATSCHLAPEAWECGNVTMDVAPNFTLLEFGASLLDERGSHINYIKIPII